MDMERKVFEFKIDDLDEEGKFSGYLSTFGNVDEGGDLVERGAFRKTLKDNKGFPLIIQHQPFLPSLAVGAFNGREDERGLKIDGEYFLDIEEGQKAYQGTKRLLKKRVKVGLSMGYKTIKKEDDEVDGIPIRRLKEVKLYEGSLTLFPMNTQAGIEAVKEEMAEDIETKPSENNHICRINSGDYSRFRSEKRKSDGKTYTIRFGIRKSDGKAEEYEYFYPIDEWSAPEARSHCKGHEGRFEAATKKGDEFLNAISRSFCESCSETLTAEPSDDTRQSEPSPQNEPDPLHSTLKEIARGLKNKKGEKQK